MWLPAPAKRPLEPMVTKAPPLKMAALFSVVMATRLTVVPLLEVTTASAVVPPARRSAAAATATIATRRRFKIPIYNPDLVILPTKRSNVLAGDGGFVR